LQVHVRLLALLLITLHVASGAQGIALHASKAIEIER
jgi:hypothetical protein